MSTEQTTRESRSSQEREKVWTPPNNLDVPTPPEGYAYRWIRVETKGVADDMNVVKRIRQHYIPVMASELPSYESPVVETGKHAGVIRSGDLILCKVPLEIQEQRNAYFREQTLKLQRQVDTELRKHSTKEMPIIDESKTEVTKRGRPRKNAHFKEE